ncbi:MAG: ATP-dependent DNA helicase RecG [Candidatus Dojkabacteria bacterium]
MVLIDPVTTLKFISESYAKKLAKLGIYTLKDLLTHFPRDYSDTSKLISIHDIFSSIDNLDEDVLLKGKIYNFKNTFTRSKLTIQTAILEDETGQIELIFFNQPYLQNSFKKGHEFLVFGKIKKSRGGYKLFPKSTEIILDKRENVHLGRITPEYKLTQGISRKWFRNRIHELIQKISDQTVEIPNEAEKYISFDISTSLKEVHFPTSFESLEKASLNLATLELINVHLKTEERNKNKSKKSKFIIKEKTIQSFLKEFVQSLEFELTEDQKKVLKKSISELSKKEAANILIQGDVGSGKTIIAIILAYLFAKQGVQTAILAPTTVLAAQHFDNFKKTISDNTISIDLVSSENTNSKASDILIGTSAILARKKKLISNLGLVIVDEQHRFGVAQREELLAPFIKKENTIPHFINMTATPIPRTIAETFFGDIKVLNINSKPNNRKPIKTYIVPENKREDCYAWVQNEISKEKIQVYWICPLIEESEKLQVKAASTTFKEIKKRFPNFKVELLHGKIKSAEKEKIMDRFAMGKIDILVSTSVIEVGIDVPNATVIIVESAERFGLAQLHQIRGRVGRGYKQSHCFLFSSEKLTEKGKKRLDFLAKNNNGLEIAKFDLMMRGPGEVYGEKQSGIPNLKIAKLNNISLVLENKKIAKKLYKNNVKEIYLFS